MATFVNWSRSASGNASAGGFTLAEGQAPSTVNDSIRNLMAQIRAEYTPSKWGWIEHSSTASVASQTTVKIGADQTADYVAGRKVKIFGGSQIRFAEILSSSFTTETTITIANATGSLSSSTSRIAVAGPYDKNLPTSAAVGSNTVTFSASVYFQSQAAFLTTPSFSTGIVVGGVTINTGQNRQTGATYTLALTDGGKIIEMNSASAQIFIVPAHTSVAAPVGTAATIVQFGAGAVSVSAAGGVTVLSYGTTPGSGGFRKLLGQYAAALLYQTSTTDTWVLTGNITS
jgi:hypothetical protein